MTWAFEPSLICCSWCNAPIIIVIVSLMILPKEPAYNMQCQDCVGEVDQVWILRFDSILLMVQNPADELRLVVYCLLATNYRNFHTSRVLHFLHHLGISKCSTLRSTCCVILKQWHNLKCCLSWDDLFHQKTHNSSGFNKQQFVNQITSNHQEQLNICWLVFELSL